jgi:hypothetical protein
MKCPDYVGVTCVDGNCPNALYEEYPWATERYENCEGCPYDKGCIDCASPEMMGISEDECRKKHGMMEEATRDA